jgi:hypothetical protein
MARQPVSFLTPEQYLEIERKAEFRSEYIGGEMFAMSGGTWAHSLIAVNTTRQASLQLREKPCAVQGSDMRVRVSPSGLYTYPDAIIICGGPQFADDCRDTVLNPAVIVEVLSPSTEATIAAESSNNTSKSIRFADTCFLRRTTCALISTLGRAPVDGYSSRSLKLKISSAWNQSAASSRSPSATRR